MQIYSVDENGTLNSLEKNLDDGKLTADVLKNKVDSMDIMADLEILSPYRAVVRVHKGMGTTMFHASGEDNHTWLQFNSIKKEDKGSVTVYHFAFD